MRLRSAVNDTFTAEGLRGATVRLVELPGVGTGADAHGAFSLAGPAAGLASARGYVLWPFRLRSSAMAAAQKPLFSAQVVAPALAARLHAMPKVELHVHLEGTADAATIWELARRNRLPLPARTLAE